MNAVSPTRSTRTLLALSCWQTAGVARTSIARTSMSKRTSAELSGFKNDLHPVRCEPGQTPQATTNWIVEAGGRPEISCFFLKGANAGGQDLARWANPPWGVLS